MPVYTLEKHDYLLLGLEGVGAYKSGATPALTVADSNRCQGFTIVNTPTLEETNDKTPRRNGLPLQEVGETNDWTMSQWFRDFTVPDPDVPATRPTVDRLLQACGFLPPVYDNSGSPIRTLVYTLGDYVDLMDSAAIQMFKVYSDGANAEQMDLLGMRGTATIKLTPGRPWELSAEGKGVLFTGPTLANPVLSPTYPAVAPVRFAESGNVVLTQVGASGNATYTGPIMNLEIRTLMNIGETPGGDQSGVDEITLIPQNAYEWDVMIDRQALAAYNAKNLLDTGAIITAAIDHPTATAGNTLEASLVGQAMTIEEGVVSNGRETYTIKCKGVYSPSGLVAVPAFSFTFRTV